MACLVVVGHFELAAMPEHKIQKVTVSDLHSLGLSGRAGREIT